MIIDKEIIKDKNTYTKTLNEYAFGGNPFNY
jgi:hypothetical protein